MSASDADPPFGAFERVDDDSLVDEAGNPDFAAIHRSPEFVRIRRRLLLFVFPMSALFFAWYLGYVLLAAYAEEFMSRELFGRITVGLVLGLSQFVTTIVITMLYVSFAKRRVDPQVDALRKRAGADR